MIVIAAFMKARDDNEDDLEKVTKSFAPRFLKDPGCVPCQAHRRVDNPNKFFFYEKYENDEEYHSSAPHFKEISRAMEPFVDGKTKIAIYNEI